MIFRAFAFVAALIAGMILSQVPEFAQQYRQRLGGAVDELARVISHFDEDARAFGLYSRRRAGADGAEQRAPDPRPGCAHARDDRPLRAAAAPSSRPSPRPDRSVGWWPSSATSISRWSAATLGDFEPAIPTTIEGIVFAGGGFLAAYLILGGMRLLFYAPRRRVDARSRYLTEQRAKEPDQPSG